MGITDGTTGDGDIHTTTSLRECSLSSIGAVIVLVINTHLTMSSFVYFIQSIAYRAQTTATIDRAKHRAARDVQSHRTGYVASSIGIARESTTSTKDVTIYVAGTPGAYLRTYRDRILRIRIILAVLYVHRHITQHVTILTTAKG